ncbi:hypothetical protein [Hyalangium versicolor]|uniref:hypothetical protein n=1 Tax=Hyalangium versicolor TaxID=2861190 RepID=UPI001CCE07B2|nr:hypothetical protein [Hyalangium versicolor]
MEHGKRKGSAASGKVGSLCGLWLLVMGLVVGACRDSVGTALYVTIDFPSSIQMDQLLVSGVVAGSSIGPHVLPEQPERLLANGETFRILLSSVQGKAEAELTVEGMRQGERVALGTNRVEVREGDEVDITVHLDPASPDGEPNGGSCPDCASGCCANGICTSPAFNTCGTGGVACVTCDPRTSNACSPQGACVCGQGPACDPITADQCINGQCKCGNASACGFGQECVAGKCECTPTSCGGCCNGNVCAPGNNINACGRNGVTCEKCKKTCNSTGTCS